MRKLFSAVLGLPLLVLGCAAGGSARGPVAAPASSSRLAETGITPGVIDGDAAHELVAAGVKVVDVRTAQEFQAGHIPGAVNIPHDQMASRYAEIGPSSTPVLLYCGTGRRSGLAATTLRAKGFVNLYDLQSYSRWLAAEPADGGR